MSVGLIALLDDVIGLAKIAAASVDDVAAQAAKAGVKAAGVVIDDAAVTPRYVIGLSPARELPIIWSIALGSLRNKLLVLLPVALALSLFAPWAITPLLMIGGAYLCYEGAEKVYEALLPHKAHAHEAGIESVALNPRTLEDQKIASAVKTDFILSAEIMAITLAAVPDSGFWGQAAVLAVVGLGITVLVYGAVALIVKADDAGLALASRPPDAAFASVLRPLGRGIVRGMPWFLTTLSVVGTAAMIWVGGGIVVHGLEAYGVTWPGHVIHEIAVLAVRALPPLAGTVGWLVAAAGSGLFGLALGAALIPATSYALAPAWVQIKGLWTRSA